MNKSERRVEVGMAATYESAQKRPIEVFGFGSGPLSVLVFGGVHGDEIEGIDVCAKLLDELNSKRLELPEQVKLTVIPSANPDGTFLKQRSNANDVDLNRNLPTSNWRADATNPRYKPGPAPASELETKAFLAIVDEVKPRFIISLHSFSETLLLFPSFEANLRYRPLVDKMARAMNVSITEKMNYEIFGSLSRWGFENDIAILTVEILRSGKTHLTAPWLRELTDLLTNLPVALK